MGFSVTSSFQLSYLTDLYDEGVIAYDLAEGGMATKKVISFSDLPPWVWFISRLHFQIFWYDDQLHL